MARKRTEDVHNVARRVKSHRKTPKVEVTGIGTVCVVVGKGVGKKQPENVSVSYALFCGKRTGCYLVVYISQVGK